jgi:hypothetical protein
MLLAFGALLMVLGPLSGAVLIVTATGFSALEPGLFAGLAYPFLTSVGMGLVASSQSDERLVLLMRWTGRLCVLVGMGAAVFLVLTGLGLIAQPMSVPWLIWLLICGSSLGAAGELASRRPASA